MRSREKFIGYYKNIWRMFSHTYLKFDINKCFGGKIKIVQKIWVGSSAYVQRISLHIDLFNIV